MYFQLVDFTNSNASLLTATNDRLDTVIGFENEIYGLVIEIVDELNAVIDKLSTIASAVTSPLHVVVDNTVTVHNDGSFLA